MMKTYVPTQRSGQPEEIADATLWICESATRYGFGFSETPSARS